MQKASPSPKARRAPSPSKVLGAPSSPEMQEASSKVPSRPPRKKGRGGNRKCRRRTGLRKKDRTQYHGPPDSSSDGEASSGASLSGRAPPVQVVEKGSPRSRRGGPTLASEHHTASAIAAKGWRVPVMINGEKSRFLVDSGSDVTVLPLDRLLEFPCMGLLATHWT